MHPFLQLVANDHRVPEIVRSELGVNGDEDRIPVVRAHRWLAAVASCTSDPELGLKAGSHMTTGELGVIDYVLSTAPTVGDALRALVRYVRLLDEALEAELREEGPVAVLRLSSLVTAPPVSEDLLLSALYHTQPWLSRLPGLECWFVQPRPAADRHERVFAGATCRFTAPHAGFAFPRESLQMPLERSDPRLHEVVRKLAEITISGLPSHDQRFHERVRALLARELSAPDLTASMVARRLHVSVRTLARRLDAEGTSFYALLDETRRVRALELIRSGNMPLAEVAFVLGFAHLASFHRAFKRWTGRSPSSFRVQQEPISENCAS